MLLLLLFTVPSEVQNLQVENVDVNLIEISYDDPAENARCVAPNKWQCQKTTLTGSCSGYTSDIRVHVKKNKKKKTPEAKKRHCENYVRRCDPSGYVPNCGR